MKNLVLTDFHELNFREASIPAAGEGEVVIKVLYAGICGSDQHIFAGKHPTAKPPVVMGHEFCGEIYEIGPGCRGSLAKGDLVSAHPVIACGCCEGCSLGMENQCRDIRIQGIHKDGFFTQYVTARADKVVRFASDTDPQVAALVEPLAVAVHDVIRSGFEVGDDVLIAGAGTIGVMIGLVARLSGAGRVAMTELDPARIAIAREFGFEVVDVSDPDCENRCAEYVNGGGYDRVFEVTAAQSGFDLCTRMVKTGGVMVQVGMPPKGFSVDINKYIYYEVDLRGVRIHPYQHFARAAKIIRDGRLNDDLKRIVSEVFPGSKAREAFFAARENKRYLKVLIKMDEE